jgi:hypothetical protein
MDSEGAATSCLLSAATVCDVRVGPLCVLDWDDTLLPSSHISSMGDDAETSADIRECEEAAIALVERLLFDAYRVCIVTNAEEGWVDVSCRRHAPRLAQFVSKCQVISARSAFERASPANPAEWKLRAFHALVDACGYARSGAGVILSIGDSLYERDAAHAVARLHPNLWVKSIKLLEKPSAKTLAKQLAFARAAVEVVLERQEHLDLMIREE